MTVRQHSTRDVVISYRIDGAGSVPLICIHGVGSNKESWCETGSCLQDEFSILSFDLRGHGDSTKIKGRYDIDDFVNDTLSVADAAGFHVFHLAGFSLGGLIAQRIALMHPGRVSKLYLLSTVANRTPEERSKVLARLASLQSSDRGAHYEGSIKRWFTDEFVERNSDLVAKLRSQNAKNDPDCYAAAYRVLAETDFGGLLDQIKCPTLIATGDEDLGSNVRMAQSMHEAIPRSQLHILTGLRHSVLVEAPERVAALIRSFAEEGA